MNADLYWLLPLFFVSAFVYSSVGHGGGSAYLALMAFTALPQPTIRSTALALNIVVALAGFISYHREQHFRWRLLLPFAIGSVPLAFIGGSRQLSPKTFCIVVGVTLALSAVRLVFVAQKEHQPVAPRLLWLVGPVIGAGLGWLAGVVGVGGGIFLSPLLLFLGWADPKQTAAVSAAFILVNSVSGLAGQARTTELDWALIGPAAGVVVVAGILGSRLGARRMPVVVLQRMLALVLALAALHLLNKAFG